ncbi:hypothetical protein MuYL_4693 [Mucilaginibacter xinganensis]|uniref:Uncharacterized protein n=1 Tax=Mucilaginibacter xinganensis TaxID=1234841 RepID=A0A223P3C3_9SPHI|nr:hypothetical protein MuYL_4693 [Mucilaginibacter xinganensis]
MVNWFIITVQQQEPGDSKAGYTFWEYLRRCNWWSNNRANSIKGWVKKRVNNVKILLTVTN